MHLVVTGFRAFPGVPENPSQALVEHCREEGLLPEGTHYHLLDVSYASVPGAVESIMAGEPGALILTGYSHRARGLTLEARAHDRRDPAKPDAEGFAPAFEESASEFALTCPSDLEGLAGRLRNEGLPAGVSHDAGAYLCNLSYLTALRRILDNRLATSALFLHLPAITGTPLAETSAASLHLPDMARGLATVAETLLAESAARR